MSIRPSGTAVQIPYALEQRGGEASGSGLFTSPVSCCFEVAWAVQLGLWAEQGLVLWPNTPGTDTAVESVRIPSL